MLFNNRTKIDLSTVMSYFLPIYSKRTSVCYRIVSCRIRMERIRKFWEYILCTDCNGQGNDFESIPTVKMETRHPVEGLFGGEFLSIYNHCGVMNA